MIPFRISDGSEGLTPPVPTLVPGVGSVEDIAQGHQKKFVRRSLLSNAHQHASHWPLAAVPFIPYPECRAPPTAGAPIGSQLGLNGL